MLYVLTPEQMREADSLAIEAGTPGAVLMERAGAAVAARASRMLGGAYGKRIVVLAGKGNNGGDGLVVARKLSRQGALVRVALMCAPEDLRGDALVMYERLVPSRIAVGRPGGKVLGRVCDESDLLVDALFGTGFSGALTGDAARWVDAANGSGRPMLAVDIPSGVDGLTGVAGGPAIRSDRTVAIAALKTGHVLGDGIANSGRLEVVEIGIDATAVDPAALVPEPGDVTAMLNARRPDAHKWSAGSVLVVAGSRGMSGAAVMASRAALEAGAGIVTAAVPASIQPVVAEASSEIMTLGMPETESGGFDRDAFGEISASATRFSVVALGPGLGRDESTRALVIALLSRLEIPFVVDADALNLLGVDAVDVIGGRRATTIITPHPGELGRLLGTDAAAIEAERMQVATSVAAKWGCVVLLKGPRTIVAGEGVPMVNPTGGPELATAGSGDVLTGVVAAFLAAGAAPQQAAASAAFVHGLAGSVAGGATGGRGVVALDIAASIPEAISGLEAGVLPESA